MQSSRVSIVTAKDLTVGYPGNPVVSNVNFAIERGEFVAICGPNGVGKSTLVKTIAGILSPIKGLLLYDFNPAEIPVGYVPQRDKLDSSYPFTTLEMVLMGRSPRLSPLARIGAKDRDIGRHCLAQVGLEELKNSTFQKLSGGQRQRVLIARALASEPSLLILDEPTAGVDIVAEGAIMSFLLTLHRDRQLTVLMVSHHVELVRAQVPLTMLVDRGVVQLGASEHILASPSHGGTR